MEQSTLYETEAKAIRPLPRKPTTLLTKDMAQCGERYYEIKLFWKLTLWEMIFLPSPPPEQMYAFVSLLFQSRQGMHPPFTDLFVGNCVF
jgi:hypothetical protein